MAQRTHVSQSDHTVDFEDDEIYLEPNPGRPVYIHLKVGDLLQEGDAFHREQGTAASPNLNTWEVTGITPESVIGREVATGEEDTWSRDDIEAGLTVGTYSTNLTDFNWISVYQVGDWESYDPDGAGEGLAYSGKPYVTVVAYGDNGLKYGRRYRFVDQHSRDLMLWERDHAFGKFDEQLAIQLDDRIRAAVEAEGFSIVESRNE